MIHWFLNDKQVGKSVSRSGKILTEGYGLACKKEDCRPVWFLGSITHLKTQKGSLANGLLTVQIGSALLLHFLLKMKFYFRITVTVLIRKIVSEIALKINNRNITYRHGPKVLLVLPNSNFRYGQIFSWPSFLTSIKAQQSYFRNIIIRHTNYKLLFDSA